MQWGFACDWRRDPKWPLGPALATRPPECWEALLSRGGRKRQTPLHEKYYAFSKQRWWGKHKAAKASLSADFPSCLASPFAPPAPPCFPFSPSPPGLCCQPVMTFQREQALGTGPPGPTSASPVPGPWMGAPRRLLSPAHLEGLQEQDMLFSHVGLCHLSGPGSFPKCLHS